VRSRRLLIGLVLGLGCERADAMPLPAADGEGGHVAVAAPREMAEPAEPEPSREPEAPPYGLPELTERERAAMYSGRADTIKPMRIHHVVGNETRHDLFFPFIRDRGGAYLGVAADANYTIIAVA
jgi:hypothetical protein